MIELSKLSETDIGAWVEYWDKFDSKPDRGRIKSWNEKFIFVVYRCGGHWDEFEKYTGVATDPGDLSFVREEKEEEVAGHAEREMTMSDQYEHDLRVELRAARIEIERLKKLITELCDALTRVRAHLPPPDLELIQRAREASK